MKTYLLVVMAMFTLDAVVKLVWLSTTTRDLPRTRDSMGVDAVFEIGMIGWGIYLLGAGHV